MILAADRCRERSPNIYVADSVSEVQDILNPRLGDVAMVISDGAFSVYRLTESSTLTVDGSTILSSNSCEFVWLSAGSGSGGIDVTLFGADPTGQLDSTFAIQQALDLVPNYSSVYFPDGEYLISGLVFSNKVGVTLYSNARPTLRITGTGSGLNYAGLKLSGTLTNCTIRSLRFVGDGVVGSNQGAIWSNMGITISGLLIENCIIEDVVVGIVLSGSTGDSFDAIIRKNWLYNIVGTGTGQGYGIATSLGGGGSSRTLIEENWLYRCQRHSIYWSVGVDGNISFNRIIEHRHGQITPGFTLGAMPVIRSGRVTVQGNLFLRCNDTGLEIGSDVGDPESSVTVMGNEFSGVQDEFPDILIGQSSPSTTGTPTNITIMGNNHERDGRFHSPIEYFCGKNVVITGNTYRITNAIGNTSPIHFILQGEGAGTADFTDNVTFSHNTGYLQGAGTNYGAIFDAASSVVSSSMKFAFNQFEGVSQFFRFLAAQTNTNIQVFMQETSGWIATGGTPIQCGTLACKSTITTLGVINTDIGTAGAGQTHQLLRTTAGVARIGIGLVNAESGGNSGSDLFIYATDDSGNFLGTLGILRRNSLVHQVGVGLALPENAGPSGFTDQAILFAQDNGAGKTKLMVQFPSGLAQQLAIEV